MKALTIQHQPLAGVQPNRLEREVTDWDQRAYRSIISTVLSPEQKARVVEPPEVFPGLDAVVAIHWHPEFVPLDLVMQRVDAMFPNRRHELIIPTQHNGLMSLKGYVGVEVDCYSAGFNRKVQLLVHFTDARLGRADVLKAMLAHTFKYRSSQLFEFIDSIVDPRFELRVQRAASQTGATDELIDFVRVHVARLRTLIDRNQEITPAEMIKNKLLRYYFDLLREHFDDHLIHHAQVFLSAVKEIVKAEFALSYFYRTEEVIEEVRGIGGGIVIPHPEQFWPILLADYDVDGIEVWNPQSQEYTDFLIHYVHGQNKARQRNRRLLVFLGDDTHFGEKVLEPRHQDPEKAGREVGVQSAWDDVTICKSLIVAKVDRRSLIEEYRQRLE